MSFETLALTDSFGRKLMSSRTAFYVTDITMNGIILVGLFNFGQKCYQFTCGRCIKTLHLQESFTHAVHATKESATF